MALARMEPDLDEALDRLPEKYRTALILHHVEGRAQEDIARLEGARPSAVSMRLARGREMLRTFLLRRGVALPAGLLSVLLSREAPGHVLSLVKGALSAMFRQRSRPSRPL
jgi:hypothetical protein